MKFEHRMFFWNLKELININVIAVEERAEVWSWLDNNQETAVSCVEFREIRPYFNPRA